MKHEDGTRIYVNNLFQLELLTFSSVICLNPCTINPSTQSPTSQNERERESTKRKRGRGERQWSRDKGRERERQVDQGCKCKRRSTPHILMYSHPFELFLERPLTNPQRTSPKPITRILNKQTWTNLSITLTELTLESNQDL